MNNTMKSTGAVLAGLIAIVVLSVGTDFALETLGVFPSFKEQSEHGLYIGWMLVLATIYRSIYAVVGSYLTATLAQNRPMLHAMILGIIGLVLSTIGAIVMWDKSPAWYPISLIILALPCAWLGGKLKSNK
jgi:uncharacterized membrane protein